MGDWGKNMATINRGDLITMAGNIQACLDLHLSPLTQYEPLPLEEKGSRLTHLDSHWLYVLIISNIHTQVTYGVLVMYGVYAIDWIFAIHFAIDKWKQGR